MQEIRIIANDNTVLDSEKICRIKKALNREKPLHIHNIRKEFLELSTDSVLYDLQESKSLRLQNRLSSVLKALNLQAEQQTSSLIEAVNHFRIKDGNITEQAPIAFLDESERKALYKENGTFRISLYKVFLFKHVASAIKSGKLNLAHSYKYRPLDEYMISVDRWNEQKNQLLERAGLLNLLDSKAVLKQLDQSLYKQYQSTNARAIENEHLSFKADG